MGQRGMAPGFRFSPTDEELVVYYLMNYACGKEYPQGVIAEVDLYKHEPWELAGKAVMSSKDPVWYFFNSQDKHHHSARINRTTSKGYWKATGKDRKICCGAQTVGKKKTLIYYEGRAPSGKRTDWIMHEYKLDEELEKRSNTICTTALCRVRRKGGPGPRNGEQFGTQMLYGDEGEDVEDNGNENFQNSIEVGGDEVQSSFRSEDPNVLKNTASLEVPEAGFGMLNVLKDCVEDEKGPTMVFPLEMQGGTDGADMELYAFLESFFPDTSQSTVSGPQILSSMLGEGYARVDGDYADSLPDVQSLLDDIEVRENEREEQILREIKHFVDGGQCEAIGLGGVVSPSDIGTVPGSLGGDFIEINDINSPLDGFVLRSPVPGGHYSLDHYDEHQQRLTTSSGLESLGWSPDILHVQGSAARRARLRIPIPTPHLIATYANMPAQIEDGCDTLRQVQMGKENNISIQIGRDVCVNGEKIADDEIAAESSSGSVLNSKTPLNSPKSPSVLCKHMSSSSVVKCEEEPSKVFYAELSHTKRGGCVIGRKKPEGPHWDKKIRGRDSWPGLPHELSCTGFTSYDTPDCEAGKSNGVMQSQVLDTISSQNRDTWKSTIADLVTKTKSLSFGPVRLVGDLEDKIRSRFDDNVSVSGKLATQLLPASSYGRLKTCVISTLLRLVAAVLLIHLFLLGFHALTH